MNSIFIYVHNFFLVKFNDSFKLFALVDEKILEYFDKGLTQLEMRCNLLITEFSIR